MKVLGYVLLVLGASLWAQSGQPIITKITIAGNEATRPHIIAREVSQTLGQPFDSTLARDDRNRLYNLGIFERVDLTLRPISTREAELLVEVVETIRVVPLPLIYHLDDLGWSYGGQISYLNFRGLNQRVDFSATFGAEKTYTLLFADPWLLGDQIGVTGWLLRVFRSHPVYNFRTQIRDLEVGLLKASRDKTLSLRAATSLERRSIRWLSNNKGPDPPDSIRVAYNHRQWQSKFQLLWRTTDIWRDPTRGVRLSLFFSPVLGLDADSPTFSNLRVDGSWFVGLRKGLMPLVLGMGLSLSQYDRETPLHIKQYVGKQWVRGYHVDPDENPGVPGLQEATSVARASVELRQTIMPRRIIGQWEVGLSGVLFVDSGWGYGPGQPLQQAQPMMGYGLGLRVFLPVLHVVAVDAGLNPYGGGVHYRVRFSQAF